ncbi:asparagine synthase [Cohnella kolymensis]|uniref:asparagine synthase (glutamine-hydrolyzing) n=1 Tax=Cohnella kolymensis TaxID=1590652 RepID=A0ABR5A385_9BACL|nr:asparagine synthase-related protein [Cohnella kolymensis]KIL35407.1 asparagine synthase [Cohnella kolymensis]
MSAIAGFYQLNDEPVDLLYGSCLMDALRHYPADDIRTWRGDGIFLGCHSQWISPESDGELLPRYDNESRLAITADAILDNREDLFERLQVQHPERKRMTDSELILLAYRKWGREAPQYLIGDFAFMIWDERNRLLFGARDFSGARTLYFHHNQTRFAFCTLIQPLFTLPSVKKRLNEEWLAEFLAIPGMVEAVDTASTVYDSIGQLPPSHSITVTGGKVTLSRYCRLAAGEPLKLKSDEEYEEAFREVFETAVSARLRTNRNVGAHLSGGLDSGSVVSFAAPALREQNKLLYTYSYVPENDFEDWTSRSLLPDERPYIQSTVRHVGNISDHYLDFERTNPLDEVNDFLEIMEMPYKFFENSFWMRGIYQRANQHGVGLLLNGARGNFTISWGSAWEYYANLLKRLKWIRLYQELSLFSSHLGARKSKVLTVVAKKAAVGRSLLFPAAARNEFPAFINPAFAAATNVYSKLQDHRMDAGGTTVESAYEVRKNQFEQLYFWNKNGTLGTKLSLRYALWDRDPTNDLRVIRFCLAVPEEQYVQNGYDRALVRRATRNLLPDKVRLNQHIRGVQGADVIHRMARSWPAFIDELDRLAADPLIAEFIHIPAVTAAMGKLGKEPRPEYAFLPEFKLLTRSLIVYRFVKNLERR